MNIIVNLHGGGICCRPDTTWERENRDFYSPDFIRGYLYSPVLFARIAKAGKCIAQKFAGRHYDSVGYGMLMYPAELMAGRGLAEGEFADAAEVSSRIGVAWASCLDHTTILPFPMYNRITLESADNIYRIFRNGNEIFSTHCGTAEMIEKAVSESSRFVSVRIGDMVAIELASPSALTEKPEETGISATFCENELYSFKIIF